MCRLDGDCCRILETDRLWAWASGIGGPSREPRFEYEWDVQLSRKGKARFGDRTHINVSPDGYFAH